MPTNIQYFANGEVLNEEVLNRPLENVNANLSEIFIDGIPQWNSSTTYISNSLVRVSNTIYYSLTSGNLNKPPLNNPTEWKLYEGNRQATLSERGTVRISDATNSTSSTTAASSKAVNNHRISGEHDGRYYTQAQVDALIASSVPTGVISLWSGSTASIPTGWGLCNGTSGTPDLRNKFIVGAGSTYAVGATGGADSVTLNTTQIPAHSHTGSTAGAGGHTHNASTGSAGSHSHTGSTSGAGSHSHSGATNTTGAHRHRFVADDNHPNSSANAYKEYHTGGYYGSDGRGSGYMWRTSSEGNHAHSLSINSSGNHTHTVSISTVGDHTHTVSVSAVADHTHTVSVSNTGGGGSHENRPPYYALAYIMKL